MIDPKIIRHNPEIIKEALMKRGADAAILDKIITCDADWRRKNLQIDTLKARRNQLSDQVAQLKRDKQDAGEILAASRAVAEEIKGLEGGLAELESRLNDLAMILPNLPHQSVKVGKTSAENTVIRSWGEPRHFTFQPLPHDELGKQLGWLDFDRAAKISGSRFVVYKGAGAALERALINFMLNLHTRDHGYTEVLTPVMVKPESLQGTGQLPKFEEELFRCRDDELYLIPTAEVSVTNLHRDEILSREQLPLNYVCFSPCFRREAGSYGKDVKGIIRQHQFNKVELVKFVEPDKSYEALEALTHDAEAVLQKLGLPYRVVELCTGDLGFAAAKTYDIEVWFPSQNAYREISSCSNFEAFQARRAAIRYRPNRESKPEYLHTLNGSGLAVGRCLAAILENYQQADGTISLPEVLPL
ncbi:serine--tRNA ligase [candidate division WOR-1 bacterium RIFOXYB2_FULL_48_7]|uniref:Serine--tRNA ligase n=1 Tax=candidate division WOR-1 bacterium RIFOXYB2_FULL_48_7 TaxID=1802583 RepID=A0A1F4T904_UNCSA|nr:MAG: serine--tRNA ligase [candidate division WOR-1 bacterium RIFOXYB2_FULL_48_7]